MGSSNPVSPKVIAGGLGAIGLPALIALLAILAENLHLITGLPPLVYQVAAVIGAVTAGYFKTDPLRIPTVSEDAVDQLNTPE